MYTIVTTIHVIACLFLIGVVLLQQGKGADMGAVFGGSSSTIFGSSGAGNFLTRLTTAMAIMFMATSLFLSYSSAKRISSTVFDAAPSEPPPLETNPNPEAQPPAAGEPQAGGAAPAEPQAAPPVEPQGAAPAGEPQAAAPQAEAPGAPQAQQ